MSTIAATLTAHRQTEWDSSKWKNQERKRDRKEKNMKIADAHESTEWKSQGDARATSCCSMSYIKTVDDDSEDDGNDDDEVKHVRFWNERTKESEKKSLSTKSKSIDRLTPTSPTKMKMNRRFIFGKRRELKCLGGRLIETHHISWWTRKNDMTRCLKQFACFDQMPLDVNVSKPIGFPISFTLIHRAYLDIASSPQANLRTKSPRERAKKNDPISFENRVFVQCLDLPWGLKNNGKMWWPSFSIV